MECIECEKKGLLLSQASRRPNMTFAKFTHMFIKIPPSKSETEHGVHEM